MLLGLGARDVNCAGQVVPTPLRRAARAISPQTTLPLLTNPCLLPTLACCAAYCLCPWQAAWCPLAATTESTTTRCTSTDRRATSWSRRPRRATPSAEEMVRLAPYFGREFRLGKRPRGRRGGVGCCLRSAVVNPATALPDPADLATALRQAFARGWTSGPGPQPIGWRREMSSARTGAWPPGGARTDVPIQAAPRHPGSATWYAHPASLSALPSARRKAPRSSLPFPSFNTPARWPLPGERPRSRGKARRKSWCC